MTRVPWTTDGGSCLIRRGRAFVKMHGLRNDFIIVDARTHPYHPCAAEVRRICDRREGVGGDELVIIEPPDLASRGPLDPNHVAFVRIFNPDGKEVDACGNASRCVAWLLMKECGSKELAFRTRGGLLRCRMAGAGQVSVTMGRLRTAWNEIPLAKPMDTLHLEIGAGPLRDPVGMNIGNPHAIFFVNDLDAVDLCRYGPELQTHSLFPEQANIGVAELLNEKTLRLSVWERPGSLTTACGTGACAAVGAARRRGLTAERRVRVLMPAGSVVIEIDETDEVTMTGPAEPVYAGYLPVFDEDRGPRTETTLPENDLQERVSMGWIPQHSVEQAHPTDTDATDK